MNDNQLNQDRQPYPIQNQQQIAQQQLGQFVPANQVYYSNQYQPFVPPIQQIQPQMQQQPPYQGQQQNLQQPPPPPPQNQDQNPPADGQAPKPLKKQYKLKLKFEELGVYRRAALGLLPNVNDPELQETMAFSTYKSSRKYKFLDPKNLSVTLEGGYRLCRATRFLPVNNSYYWEIDFTSIKNEESHIRVGIATIKADMEAPVGYDQYGYCIGDLGKSIHERRERGNFKTPQFHVSDTVGLGFIPGPDSISLQLFINGVDYGIVFDGINKEERWTPAVSIFREAVVTGRFFRPFKFDPGNQWMAAGDIPRENPDLPILAKDLVKAMKGTMVLSESSDLYMSAIYIALTPAHQMPI